jgi:ABC-type nitrate/sulfonate/bicarbonate transport system substrate-binding protein
VLRPGGTALAAYLNSWGLIRTGITDFPTKYEDPSFVRSMMRDGGLSIWYWSTPVLERAELGSVGFYVVAYGGMEGFAGGMWPLIEKLAQEHPQAYEHVVDAAVESCELPQYRDATDHLTFILPATDRGYVLTRSCQKRQRNAWPGFANH